MGPRASLTSPAYDAAPHLGLHEDRDTPPFWRYCDNFYGPKAIEQRTLGVCPLAILDSPRWIDPRYHFRPFCKYLGIMTETKMIAMHTS
jgi:hypothetical protein